METYDVVVIGAGDAGLSIAFNAASANFRVALLEKNLVGGTCVNTGCVPSKTLIHAADEIMAVRKAAERGIRAERVRADFGQIMERMRQIVTHGRSAIRDGLDSTANIDFIEGESRFTGPRTLMTPQGEIRAGKIFIASGSRPKIPQLPGLDSVPYLTSETLLGLETLPQSMIIIGGGYVGIEYAHFFDAMGCRVQVVDRDSSLLTFEDREVSELLTREIGKRVSLHLGCSVEEIRSGPAVLLKTENGELREISASALMIATGRKPNTDLLNIETAGLEVEPTGYIRTDEFLATNKRHIWAVGDANGKAMFTHAADREAEIAWRNASGGRKRKMDYGSVPHAVFTWPQIASIGLTEQAASKDHDVAVGKAMYADTVMGEAMAESDGFAKVILDRKDGRLLGVHVIGPHAAILIQEAVNAFVSQEGIQSITRSMHIFPSLSYLIPEAVNKAKQQAEG